MKIAVISADNPENSIALLELSDSRVEGKIVYL